MKDFLAALLFFIIVPLSPTLADSDEIRFGATFSLAGGAAPFSQACKNAIVMATDDVNSSGGVSGKKIRVIIEDFGNLDLKRAAAAANKLISHDKVEVLFSNWSEDTEVVSPIAERSGVLTIDFF
jgi:branched-chain amino acid transport system substrate-binding protein